MSMPFEKATSVITTSGNKRRDNSTASCIFLASPITSKSASASRIARRQRRRIVCSSARITRSRHRRYGSPRTRSLYFLGIRAIQPFFLFRPTSSKLCSTKLLASTSPERFKPPTVILRSLWSLPLPCKPQTTGYASCPPLRRTVRVRAAAVNAAYLQCRTIAENRLVHPHNVEALGKPNLFLGMLPVQHSCHSHPTYAAPRVSGLTLGLCATIGVYARTIVSAIERDSRAVERGNPARTHRPRPCC